MEKIENLFKNSSVYDSKHINNLSTEKVPAELLQAIEKGCSIETLQDLAGKKFPICKYETQITIHGIFDTPSTNRVGIYANLFQNKNKSLGVRWSAIDIKKRAKLYGLIKSVTTWKSYSDSQNYYLYISQYCSNAEEAQKKLTDLKKSISNINTDFFTGNCSAFLKIGLWGQITACAIINVQCFPVENLEKIVENITGMKYNDVERIKREQDEKREAERKKANEEAEKRYQERKKQEQQEEEERRKAVEIWKQNNPINSQFKELNNYTIQPGDVFINGIGGENGEFYYQYFKASKSFGRLIFTRCNEDETKMTGAKGYEPIRKTFAKIFVKRA